jgi:hypothetical protein
MAVMGIVSLLEENKFTVFLKVIWRYRVLILWRNFWSVVKWGMIERSSISCIFAMFPTSSINSR